MIVEQIIAEVDANTKLSEENSERIDAIEATDLLHTFDNIVQQEVISGQFTNPNFKLDVLSVTSDAKFILADVWINDSENQNWSVTFSKDYNNDCRAGSLPATGTAPMANFDGRTQTTSVFYAADGVDQSEAFPRFGQWS